MATWTTIPNGDVAVGAPVDTALMTALRDNPQAIAEGASGAPKIANAAFSDGTIGAEKFQTGSTEEVWVAERVAARSVGFIGTYVYAHESLGTSQTRNAGNTRPGSSINYGCLQQSSGAFSFVTEGTLSGTWRLMGAGANTGGATTATYISVWLRIS